MGHRTFFKKKIIYQAKTPWIERYFCAAIHAVGLQYMNGYNSGTLWFNK